MDSQFLDNWETQIRKGLVGFCVLKVVARKSIYGYDIVRALRQIKGLVISEGTIYPLLNRLKRDGLIRSELKESKEGPARKYYELTALGKRMLSKMDSSWITIVQSVDRLDLDINSDMGDG